MGFFSMIKMIREEKKRIAAYLKMDTEALSRLSDEELCEALRERILCEEGDMETLECLDVFKGAKRVFYVVNYFDMEVQNGGLCQYFVNSSRDTAPYLLACLNEIGAAPYELLVRSFVTDNGINLNCLDSFEIEDVEEYEAQTERYPFDTFDDAYYALYEKAPLELILARYAKQHLQELRSFKEQV